MCDKNTNVNKPGTFVSTRYGDGIVLSNYYAYTGPSTSCSSKSHKRKNDNDLNEKNNSLSNIVDIDTSDKNEFSIGKYTRRSKYGPKRAKSSENNVVDLSLPPSLVKVQLSYGVAYMSIHDLRAFDNFLSIDIPSSTRAGLGSHRINRKDLFLCSRKQLFNDTLVNLYIETIQKKVDLIHITNTFFYTIICTFISSKTLSMKERERKFCKLSKLFSMNGHLVVPVNYVTHWSLAIICNIHLLRARSEELSALRKRKEDAEAKDNDRADAIEFSSTSNGRKRKITTTKAPRTLYDELMQATDADRELPCILLLDSAKCHRAQQIFANLRIYAQLMLFGADSFPSDVSLEPSSPDMEVGGVTVADEPVDLVSKPEKGPSSASSRKRKKTTPAKAAVPILIDLSDDIPDADEVIAVTETDAAAAGNSDSSGVESELPVDIADHPLEISEDGIILDAEDPAALTSSDAKLDGLNADPAAFESSSTDVHMESIEEVRSPTPTADVESGGAGDVASENEFQEHNTSHATPLNGEERIEAEGSADGKRGSELKAAKASKPMASAKIPRPRKPELLVNPISLPGFSLAVPLQMNGYDCGPFMLEFITKFSESTPTIDKAFLQSKGGDVFKRCWNTDGGTVDVMGCRNTILHTLMPYKEFLG